MNSSTKTPDAFTDLVVRREVLTDTDPVSSSARDRLLAEFVRAETLIQEQNQARARVQEISLELMRAHATAETLADLLWQAHKADPVVLNAIADYASRVDGRTEKKGS